MNDRTATDLTSGLPLADGSFDFVIAAKGGWKSSVRRMLQRSALHISRPASFLLGTRPIDAFAILMYHRVVPITPRLPEPTLNVPPDRFRAQLAGLLNRNLEAWPLSRVLRHHLAGEEVPRNVFVVTFDDGYANNYLHAFPVLRDLGVPATIFLATAYLDRSDPFPFDAWPGAQLPGEADAWMPLSTEQCQEMLDSQLIELGAHTHTHADFRGQADRFRQDMITCLETLNSKFGLSEVTFAFPQGRKGPGFVSPELVAAARDVGVLCSLTTENDLVAPDSDPFDWGRLTVERRDTAGAIAARLDGWYSLIRDLYRGRKSHEANL